MRIWAVVPVKSLADAKTRLACVLGPQERARLVCAMLAHTLTVLVNARGLAGVAVVTSDVGDRYHCSVSEVAEACGARVLREPCAQGLNVSLTWAVAHLGEAGAEGVLVLPGDLPLLRSESIALLLAAASARGVVLAPDRHHEGTNALLLAPPTLIPFCFGADSFQGHLAAARAAGVVPVVVDTPDLAVDVDLPEDLPLAGL